MTVAFRSLLFLSMAPLSMTLTGCAGRSESSTDDDCGDHEWIHDDDGDCCDPGWDE